MRKYSFCYRCTRNQKLFELNLGDRVKFCQKAYKFTMILQRLHWKLLILNLLSYFKIFFSLFFRGTSFFTLLEEVLLIKLFFDRLYLLFYRAILVDDYDSLVSNYLLLVYCYVLFSLLKTYVSLLSLFCYLALISLLSFWW